ncbi:MAG: mandelate racemase/muconate lactonizing enzyme family protein [Chloroflexi bacterium]|nr:mandelate racemase/muconate lactonizing enzyme family protein [Chloroflexota bacterium]
MKITDIEVFVLGDPKPDQPVDMSRIDGLAFVRIHTDEGITGLSEIFAVPPGVARAVLDGPTSLFGRLLIGEDPIHPERLWQKLYNSMLHGNRHGWAIICMGAVDVALWDIFGKSVGRPVYELLGGSTRSNHQITDEAQRHTVTPYCTIVSDRWDRESVLHEQVERVVRLRELGYRAFKIEPLNQPDETIIELTRRTRAAIGKDNILCVDVGYLWNDVGSAARVINQLAEFDILFFETPLPVDAVAAYGSLTRQTSVPIAMGEHTTTRWEFLEMIEQGGIQVVQPYMTTCGGLTEAKRIVEMARAHGVLVCPGNWSTAALGMATIHLAAYSPITPIFESAPAAVYWSPLRKALEELAAPVVNGVVHFPTSPGIGLDLPEELIRHFLVAPSL